MDKKGVQNSLLDAVVSVGWTHKINEKQSERYMWWFKVVSTLQLISAGVTSTGAITLFFTDKYWAKIITSIFGLISFICVGILKAWDFKELATKSKQYANSQFILRERLIDCLRDLLYNLEPIDKIISEWRIIEKERLEQSARAPQTANLSVKKASKQLKKRQDNVRETDYVLFLGQDIIKRIEN